MFDRDPRRPLISVAPEPKPESFETRVLRELSAIGERVAKVEDGLAKLAQGDESEEEEYVPKGPPTDAEIKARIQAMRNNPWSHQQLAAYQGYVQYPLGLSQQSRYAAALQTLIDADAFASFPGALSPEEMRPQFDDMGRLIDYTLSPPRAHTIDEVLARVHAPPKYWFSISAESPTARIDTAMLEVSEEEARRRFAALRPSYLITSIRPAD